MIAFLFILKKMCKIIVLSLIPQHFFKKKHLSSTYKCNFLGADNKQ